MMRAWRPGYRLYGPALGTCVTGREIGVPGPIREACLVTAGDESTHRTDVGWPVFTITD